MSAPDLLREAKRTAFILASAQAIIGSASPVVISLGGLAGFYLLEGDKALATAPVTGFNVGVAVGALPAAWLMRRVGRRYGFMAGAGVTALGGALATLALFRADFWLFATALLLLGSGGSFVQQYRFAAADNAPEWYKAKAISWVLTGGVFSAILGPQIVIWSRDVFDPVMFAGAFAALVLVASVGLVILSLLRLPRDAVTEQLDTHEPARPLSRIVMQPRFATALVCAISSYALMSFVMTGAPLAMVGCGFTPDEATLGISWHVMAMFAPSFVTGRLISRFGGPAIIATGLVLLIGCALVALSGIELWQFWTALVLLGVGWNFAFIGSTTLVTEAYRLSERNKVQGLHDFLLFSTVAFASLASGRVYTLFGWDMLNWVILPVSAACLVLLGILMASERRARRAGPASRVEETT